MVSHGEYKKAYTPSGPLTWSTDVELYRQQSQPKLALVQLTQEAFVKEVGAFEAKNKFGQLLDWVEDGEEVTITRHGKKVARLIPSGGAFNRETARSAAQRIRAMSKGVTLGDLKIKDLINEGRG
jgi:prevent-host-death family protein